MNSLRLAAKYCRGEALSFFLDKGGSAEGLLTVVAEFQGMSASYGEMSNCIDVLISKGADINEQDGSGDTPLHTVSYYRNDEMIRLLRSKGADPGIRNKNGLDAEDMYDRGMDDES